MTRLVYVKHKIIKNAKFKYQVCKQYKMKKTFHSDFHKKKIIPF